jgi:hypothetical protein
LVDAVSELQDCAGMEERESEGEAVMSREHSGPGIEMHFWCFQATCSCIVWLRPLASHGLA